MAIDSVFRFGSPFSIYPFGYKTIKKELQTSSTISFRAQCAIDESLSGELEACPVNNWSLKTDGLHTVGYCLYIGPIRRTYDKIILILRRRFTRTLHNSNTLVQHLFYKRMVSSYFQIYRTSHELSTIH